MSAPDLHEALHLLRRAHHHEIRGALNALKLQLTLLQRGRERASPDDPRVAQWVDGAAAEADAVERALGELSAVERAVESIPDSSPDAGADRTLARVLELLTPLAKSRQIELKHADAEEPASGQGLPAEWAGAVFALGVLCLARTERGRTLSFRAGSDGLEISPITALHGTPSVGELQSPSWSLKNSWSLERRASDALILRRRPSP